MYHYSRLPQYDGNDVSRKSEEVRDVGSSIASESSKVLVLDVMRRKLT
jgi:hypothetical protein